MNRPWGLKYTQQAPSNTTLRNTEIKAGEEKTKGKAMRFRLKCSGLKSMADFRLVAETSVMFILAYGSLQDNILFLPTVPVGW